jgi:hypothetical protein
MRKLALIGVAVLSLGAMAPEATEARPGGCLKYGLGGAVAGHFAGGHRWKGAAAGCALGIWQRRRAERLARERAIQRERDRGYARDFDRRQGNPSETGSIRRRAPREGSF